MKLLFVFHNEIELNRVEKIIEKLRNEHIVEIITDRDFGLTDYPLWYRFLCWVEDYRFYWKTLKHQSPHWKNRIFRDYPDWFKKWKCYQWFPFPRFFRRFYSPPKRVFDELKKIRPDVLCVTSLAFTLYHPDHDFAIAAKRMNIPVVSFIPTWDNLTTKTKIYPIADLYFAWNNWHKKELIEYHNVPSERIKIIGAFIFEQWLYDLQPTPREEFCKRYGFNPAQSIECYLGTSPALLTNEENIILQFLKRYKDYQWIIRPHPDAFIDENKLMNEDNYVRVIPSRGENSFQNLQLAFDTYYHSSAVHGINTSAFIEALLTGTITFYVRTDMPDLQENCLHFQQLMPLLNNPEGSKWLMKHLGFQEEFPSLLAKNIIEELYGDKRDPMKNAPI